MNLSDFRGLERIIIQLGGITLVILGFLLYKWGVTGKASLSVERSGVRFQLLNGAPGLFFALFGAAILCLGIYMQLELPAEGSGKSSVYKGGDRFCSVLTDIIEVSHVSDAELRDQVSALADSASSWQKHCKGK